MTQQLALTLLSPPDDLLLQVSQKWVKRHLYLASLEQAAKLTYPLFVKSLVPKQFQAQVYFDEAELLAECKGLEPNTQLLVSEVVNFTAEARAFVLENSVKTCAIYEGVGDVNEAAQFVLAFAQENPLPKTCVIDVGCLENRNWALVEANATWGAGLNGCDPLAVATCTSQATTFSD
ncbi:MAG: ATP-grasp domain-containing protein [Chloroflexota bacterium]